MHVSTHGNAGEIMTLSTSPSSKGAYTAILASSYYYPLNPPAEFTIDGSNVAAPIGESRAVADISHIYAKLVVFESCSSGADPSSGYNLFYMTYRQGATCAAGFRDHIGLGPMHYWGDDFWLYLSEGWAIDNSMRLAASDVYYMYGTYAGYDSYYWRGTASGTY